MANKKIACVLGLTVALGCLAPALGADGFYGLLGLGEQQIGQQDVKDDFKIAPYAQSDIGSTFMGSGDLTVGYTFTVPVSLELSLGIPQGRDNTSTYTSGATTVAKLEMNVPTGSTWMVSLAPSLTLEQGGFWFLKSAIHQVGASVGYAGLDGTLSGNNYNAGTTGSEDLTSNTVCWSLFYRFRGRLRAAHMNVGAELGYQGLRFDTLTGHNTTGFYAGGDGKTLLADSGANVYVDDSGPYFRLIFGFSDLLSPSTQKME